MTRLKTILESKYTIFIIIVLSLLIGYLFSLNKPYIDSTVINCKIKAIKIDGNKYIITTDNILITYYLDSKEQLSLFIDTYKIGDIIEVEGTLKEPNNNTNFNLFNYRLYLKSKKIYYLFTATNIKLIKHNSNIIYVIKNKVINKINKSKYKDYLYAFILGDTNYIDDDVNASYQSNGISHLFSVSGMHVSLLSITLLFILNKFKKTDINYVFVIIFLIYYSFLTNFTSPIMRSTILFILLFINKHFKFNIKTYILFIYIVCGFMIYNLYLLYNVGFLFSFSISFFLILYGNLTNKYNYIKRLFLTSLIAFIVSIPIMINSFFSINLLSPIFNLFFVPFISYIVFPLSFISFVIPLFESILGIMITILETISVFCTKISFNLILCHIPFYVVILYYILIVFILEMMKRKRYRYILIIYLVLLIHSFWINIDSQIHMIDVGQGDSILIRLKYNKNILIDTGGIVSYGDEWKRSNYSISKSVLIPYLKSLGINKLDYLILSHGDYDHMGDAYNLVSNFKVNKVIFNRGSYNDIENNLIEKLQDKNIDYINSLDELSINNYKLQFLNTKNYNNENDNSNVIYLNIDEYKFLFMGDAGVEKENDILDKYSLKDIDFLKVGHHGSNTSSSKEFIDSINPKYSLISVGKNNRYGHPKDETLNNLSKSQIYRTDQNGSIEIKISNNGYKIRTCIP